MPQARPLALSPLILFASLFALGCGDSSDSASAPSDGGLDSSPDQDAALEASLSDQHSSDSSPDADAALPPHYGAEFFVSLSGDDSNPGTKDRPFASLERAQQAVRALKAGSGLPNDGVVIWLRQGVYERSGTFTLGAQDSGEAGKPLAIRAYPGESVRLTGGQRLDSSWFTPVDSGSAVWSRLDPSCRGKLLQADLSAHGISNYGELLPRGFGKSAKAALELFFNGSPMTLARWPDSGVTSGQVSPSLDQLTISGDPSPNVTGTYVKEGVSDGVNSYRRQGLVSGKQYRLYRYNWDYNGSNYTAWFLTTNTTGYPGNADPWWYRYADSLGPMDGSNGASGHPTSDNPEAINHGFATIAQAPSDTAFVYAGSRPERWQAAEDLWLHGYWKYMWADLHVKPSHVDLASKTISFAEKPGYGIAAGQPYYAENLLEEITVPGEWYLDRASGILYFWPPSDIQGSETLVSLIEEPLIKLQQTSYVTISDLTLEATRSSLIRIEGGDHNTVERSVLRNAGTNAADISGSSNGIERCEVMDPGEGGVSLSGGERASLSAGGNFVRNSHLYRFSRWAWTYHPAVSLSGDGHLIAHNVMDSAPHSAILYSGNEHQIEYNEIHDVCQYSSDAGAIYSGRDWGYRGNVIRYNFLHDISSHFEGYGVHAVYLDDCLSGIRVFGNIMYRISGFGILNGGGRDNILENNIMAHCGDALYGDSRGLTAINNTPGDSWNMLERLAKDGIHYQEDPWASAYPKLALIPNDWTQISDPNQLWRYPQGCVFSKNLGFDNRNFMQASNYGGTGTFDKYDEIADNIEDQDPLFVDESTLNLNLRPESPAYTIPGFEPIPFDQIGIEP